MRCTAAGDANEVVARVLQSADVSGEDAEQHAGRHLIRCPG